MGFEEERRNTLQYPHIRFILKIVSEKERGRESFSGEEEVFTPFMGVSDSESEG